MMTFADLQETNAALVQRIREFDTCLQRVAAELGAVCCGGVDGDQSDPHSTTAVLVEAIRRLRSVPNAEVHAVEIKRLRVELQEAKDLYEANHG